jgi:hypothetical protein
MGKWALGALLRAGAGLILTLWLVNCVGGRPAALPSEGGREWRRATSQHFTVLTDLDADAALALTAELERTYALLAAATRYAAERVQSTRVIALHSDAERRRFIPANSAGYYTSSLPEEDSLVPTLLIAGGYSPFVRTLLAHELAHRFNHASLGGMPMWLNEGLAQYYSTIRGEPGRPVLGDPDPEYVVASGSVRGMPAHVIVQGFPVLASTLPPPSVLLGLDRAAFYAEGVARGYDQDTAKEANYAAAWLLVHLLLHTHADYAQEFQSALEGTASHRLGARLADIVASVEPERLDGDFRAYLRRPIPWHQQSSPRAPNPPGVKLELLPEPEVRALWDRLDALKARDDKPAEVGK